MTGRRSSENISVSAGSVAEGLTHFILTVIDYKTASCLTHILQGNVFVNGLPLELNRNWYISNTGYVLQLAAPYYEELTVRENLTLAAWVKLHISSRERFQRVEQVMEVVR